MVPHENKYIRLNQNVTAIVQKIYFLNNNLSFKDEVKRYMLDCFFAFGNMCILKSFLFSTSFLACLQQQN